MSAIRDLGVDEVALVDGRRLADAFHHRIKAVAAIRAEVLVQPQPKKPQFFSLQTPVQVKGDVVEAQQAAARCAELNTAQKNAWLHRCAERLEAARPRILRLFERVGAQRLRVNGRVALDDLEDVLGIELPDSAFQRVAKAVSFDEMKRDGERYAPNGGSFWKGGAATFLHKGTNGRWRDVFSAGELTLYDAACARALSPDCQEWLEKGGAA